MINFADEVRITVSSGKGGNGCIAFRREKFVPKGGPSGGDGGRGGDVVFEIRQNLRTLVHLRYAPVFKAKNGQDGSGSGMNGAKGADAIIPLPPGSVIRDRESGEIIHDFGEARDGSLVFLKGGNGGWGNIHFKSSTRQAPRIAYSGKDGQSMELTIELRMMADIGLVGFPNAGKSSLLDYYTNARPKIAPYPFTTKIPNLGVLHGDERDIIIADIPGIIEGAAEGAGLGIRFLKHISRTAALVFLIDLSDDNWEQAFRVLLGEMERFSPELIQKPRIVLGSKLDLPGTGERLLELKRLIPDEEVYGISVFSREGLKDLAFRLIAFVERDEKEQAEDGWS